MLFVTIRSTEGREEARKGDRGMKQKETRERVITNIRVKTYTKELEGTAGGREVTI